MDSVSTTNEFDELRLELERMNRLYDALSQIHQAIMHQTTRQELFDKVCEVAVELGGFRLAFVGWIDDRTRQVVPAAKYGNHTAFLDFAPMFADGRTLGQGPTGQSIRSKKTYICNDYFNDPATEPWHAAAAQHGFRASGTFPIKLGGRVSGVFVLYAGEVGFFRNREINMLEQAANDLSFALDNLQREEQRVRAEEGGRRLAAIVESSLDAIISEDMGGAILTWNTGAEQMYGYRAEDAIGKHISMLIPADKQKETDDLLVQVRSGRSFSGVETDRIHKCGLRFPVSITLSPVRDSGGNIVGVSKISHDISEQKASVAAVRESTGLLQVLIQETPAGLAMFDREMRMLACSKRWKSDHNLSDIEVIGWRHTELDPSIPERWKQEERRALAGETIVSPQDSYKRHDGQVRWLSRTLRPWMTGSGEIGGIVILSEDITDRKQAEDARRRSEEFLHIFIQDAPVALAMFDRELRYLGANRCWREDGNLGDEPLIGRSRYEVNPRIPEHWKQADRQALEGEMISLEEEEYTRPDGAHIWLRWEVRPWHDANGEVGGIIVFSENITARKQAEIALRESQNQFEQVVTHLDEGLVVTDLEGNLIKLNPLAVSLLHLPPDATSFNTLKQIAPYLKLYGFDGAPIPFEQWPLVRILGGEVLSDVEILSIEPQAGRQVALRCSGQIVEIGNGKRLAFLRFQDITERKQAELALADETARTQLLFDNAFDSMFLLDEEFKVVQANEHFAALLGKPLDEVYGLHPWDWDADRPTSGSLANLATQVPTLPMMFEARLQSVDGSVHEVEVSTTPTEWSGRKLIYNVVRDITARKQAEAARREAELQLRQVIDSLDEGLFIINMEGELLSANPAAQRLFGVPDEVFNHATLAEYPEFITVLTPDGSVLPPEQWPVSRALSGDRIKNQEYRTRSKYLKEDRILSYSSSIVETGAGKKLAFLRCQDVTARWLAENALRSSKI